MKKKIKENVSKLRVFDIVATKKVDIELGSDFPFIQCIKEVYYQNGSKIALVKRGAKQQLVWMRYHCGFEKNNYIIKDVREILEQILIEAESITIEKNKKEYTINTKKIDESDLKNIKKIKFYYQQALFILNIENKTLETSANNFILERVIVKNGILKGLFIEWNDQK